MGIITALFQFIVGSILYIASVIFSAFQWAVPDAMQNAITWYFLQLNYFRGIFPVETLLACIGTMFLVWGFLYAVKIFTHTILPLIPWLGKFVHFPDHNPHGAASSQAIHEHLRFRRMMTGKDKISRYTR